MFTESYDTFVYFEIYVTLLLIMRKRIGEAAFEFH